MKATHLLLAAVLGTSISLAAEVDRLAEGKRLTAEAFALLSKNLTEAIAKDFLPATLSTGETLVELADSFHPTNASLPTNSADDVGGLDRRDDWLLGTTLAVSLVLGLGVLRSGLLTESIATGPNRWRMVWPQAVPTAADSTPAAGDRRRLLPVEWWLAGGLIVLAVWQSGRRSPIESTALETGEWP